MIPHKAMLLIGGVSLILGVQTGAASAALRQVRNVILESGNPGQSLSVGYTTIETANLHCPRATCALGMRVMANIDNGTCKDQWAIIGLVDGNSVDGGPLQGNVFINKSETRIWQGEYLVGRGSHTLAFQIYVPCSARANQWSVRYTLTTP